MVVWTTDNLPDNFGEQLAEHAGQLTLVSCSVDDRTAALDDQSGETITNQAANDYNEKTHTMCEELPSFYQELVPLLIANHPDLSDDERLVDAMLFDGVTFEGACKLQRMMYGGFNVPLPWMMQLLHLYSQPRYFNHDGNGLQKLLDEISIQNEDPSIKLNGREAAMQQLQLLHLHHQNCGGPKAKLGRDSNPYGTALGNRLANLAGKRCALYLWVLCQCPIPCYPHDTKAALAVRSRYEHDIQSELVKGLFGRFPGLNESEIRAKIFQRYEGVFADEGLAAPQFLFDADVLVPRYAALEALRPRVDLTSLPRGILLQDGTTRVTFDDVVRHQASLPTGFLQSFREELQHLEPVTCELDTEDDDLKQRVHMQNVQILQRVLGMYPVFLHAVQGNIASDVRGMTDDERKAGALLYSTRPLPEDDVQQLKFSAKAKWNMSTVVNTYVKERGTPKEMMPTCPVTTKYAQLYFDYYDFWRARGGISFFLNVVSIVSPEGGLLHPTLVSPQWFEASHTTHLPLSETKTARDTNYDNITQESADDNDGRTICSARPELPCIRECLCRTECKPCLFKLSEKNLNEIVTAQLKLGQFGRFPGLTEGQIRARYVSLYCRAYDEQGVARPPYLAHYAANAAANAELNLNDEGLELEKIPHWDCSTCDEVFTTHDLAAAHEEAAHSPPTSEDSSSASAAAPDTRVARAPNQFLVANDLELLGLIKLWGWGKWDIITPRLTTCRPVDEHTLKNRAGGARFRRNCIVVHSGLTTPALKNCEGEKHGCACVLHTPL